MLAQNPQIELIWPPITVRAAGVDRARRGLVHDGAFARSGGVAAHLFASLLVIDSNLCGEPKLTMLCYKKKPI
jgi:hypothetical protein